MEGDHGVDVDYKHLHLAAPLHADPQASPLSTSAAQLEPNVLKCTIARDLEEYSVA
jgi:hypothetical protein